MRYATVNDAAGQQNKNSKHTIQENLSNIYFRVQMGMITEEGFIAQVEAAYEAELPENFRMDKLQILTSNYVKCLSKRKAGLEVGDE